MRISKPAKSGMIDPLQFQAAADGERAAKGYNTRSIIELVSK